MEQMSIRNIEKAEVAAYFDALAPTWDKHMVTDNGKLKAILDAAGSGNFAIELTCPELKEYSHSRGWIDVCKGWQEASPEEAGARP